MARIGYALSSEEHDPRQLIENARAAEEAGFDFVLDLRPLSTRGSTHRATARSCGRCSAGSPRDLERCEVGTGVTCPMIRIHPAIIAQAAATIGCSDARPLLPWRRHRREPQRAHPRRQVARARGSRRDARGGGRRHPPAVDGRSGQPPRPLLHGRERAHLRPSRSAAADPRGGRRAARRRARRADRRRAHHDRARGRCHRGLPERRR